MENLEKVKELLMEDILKINNIDYEYVLNTYVDQIESKNTLKMVLKNLIENELIRFSYKLADYLDKKGE